MIVDAIRCHRSIVNKTHYITFRTELDCARSATKPISHTHIDTQVTGAPSLPLLISKDKSNGVELQKCCAPSATGIAPVAHLWGHWLMRQAHTQTTLWLPFVRRINNNQHRRRRRQAHVQFNTPANGCARARSRANVHTHKQTYCLRSHSQPQPDQPASQANTPTRQPASQPGRLWIVKHESAHRLS